MLGLIAFQKYSLRTLIYSTSISSFLLVESCPVVFLNINPVLSRYKLILASSAISPLNSINFALIGFYGRLGLLTSPTRERRKEGPSEQERKSRRRVRMHIH